MPTLETVFINIICVFESGHLVEPVYPGVEMWAGKQSVPEEVQTPCSEGVWDVGIEAYIPG